MELTYFLYMKSVLNHYLTKLLWVFCRLFSKELEFSTTLAPSSFIMEFVENKNIYMLHDFYEALDIHNGRRVMDMLASQDLEWCFHGPPHEQHLMKLLCGISPSSIIKTAFVPTNIQSIGNRVFVEGEGKQGTQHANKCWVHVWTIRDGKIAKLREYFNTSLTVLNQSSHLAPCNTIWESQLGQTNRKSMPSLILAL